MGPEHARILVVDDEVDERELLAGVFARAGHAVQCADSAASALDSLRGGLPPDLIVLDLGMPIVSGLDLLLRLRESAHTLSVPVIVVSGQQDVAQRVASFDAGADDYVAKPINPAELLARVRHVLRAADEVASLRRGSFLDSLTGLLNRAGLDHLLGHQVELAVRQHSALAVLFLDLDGFKLVNDTHGHAVGDRILCDVARALEAQLRGSDFAARWGGDEFVVVLPAAGPQMVAGVMARLEAAVEAVPTAAGGKLGVSIGVASLFEDVGIGDDPAQGLIVAADAAMYRVKQQRLGHAPAAPSPSLDSTGATVRAR